MPVVYIGSMRYRDFEKLSGAQQLTLLIAMHIRNEMEDFHAEHLSDAQMKILNQIIRQAIFDVVSFTNTPPKTELAQLQARDAIQWLAMRVPADWEIPDKTTENLLLPEELLNQIYKDHSKPSNKN